MASYLVILFLIGIDGAGVSFDRNVSKAFFLNKFFANGSLIYVDANIPTDSAENWGSIITGVIPCKHNFKYEMLDGPYKC